MITNVLGCHGDDYTDNRSSRSGSPVGDAGGSPVGDSDQKVESSRNSDKDDDATGGGCVDDNDDNDDSRSPQGLAFYHKAVVDMRIKRS